MDKGKKTLIFLLVVFFVALGVYYYMNMDSYDSFLRKENPEIGDGEDGNISTGTEDSTGFLNDTLGITESGSSDSGEDSDDDSGGGGGGSSSDEESSSTVKTCDELSGKMRDWCYRDEAKDSDDPDLCLQIESQYYRDSCYRFIAINQKDSSYCDYMENEERRGWCHDAVD